MRRPLPLFSASLASGLKMRSRKSAPWAGQRAPEDAVRADPEVAVADEPDLAGRELAADRRGGPSPGSRCRGRDTCGIAWKDRNIYRIPARRRIRTRGRQRGDAACSATTWWSSGPGPAGENGAVQAGFLGKRVALVEKEAVPGGASANTGTIPSKALRETALAIQQARSRGAHGIEMRMSGQVTVPELMGRRGLVTGREHSRIRDALNRAGVEQLRGVASFADPHTLRVEVADGGSQDLRAEVVLLATGTRPSHPPQYTFDHVRVYDSDSILLPRPRAALAGHPGRRRGRVRVRLDLRRPGRERLHHRLQGAAPPLARRRDLAGHAGPVRHGRDRHVPAHPGGEAGAGRPRRAGDPLRRLAAGGGEGAGGGRARRQRRVPEPGRRPGSRPPTRGSWR